MLSLKHRIQTYIRFATIFLVTVIGLPILVAPLSNSGMIGLGLLIAVIFILPHIYLGFKIIEGSKLKRFLISAIVIIVSGSLLIFAIWVDKNTNDFHFNPAGGGDLSREIKYLIYFVWTSIVIWEIVSIIQIAMMKKWRERSTPANIT